MKMPARPERGWLCLVALLIACAPPATAPPAPATTPPAASAPVPVTQSSKARALTVTFRDAVVYAGATHYYFERHDGQSLRVIESHDQGSLTVDNADMLIDPNPEEGPPGPNPAWVGKSVTLHYDASGRVVAIMPAYE